MQNTTLEVQANMEVEETEIRDTTLRILITGPESSRSFAEKLKDGVNEFEFFPLDDESRDEDAPFIFKYLKPAIDLAKEGNFNVIIGVDELQQKIGLAIKKADSDSFTIMNAHQVAAILLSGWLAAAEKGKLVCLKSIHVSDMIEQMVMLSKNECHNLVIPIGKFRDEIKKVQSDLNDEVLVAFNVDQEVFHSEKDLEEIVKSLILLETSQREKGETLLELLVDLYSEYGFYKEKTISVDYYSASQKAHLLAIMDIGRKTPKILEERFPISRIIDYLKGKSVNLLTQKKHEFTNNTANILRIESPNNFTITFSPTDNKMYNYVSMKGNISSKARYADEDKHLDKEILRVIQMINKII
ncbi:hypothetical protein P872_04110 [Rhodonellum psychrophilum GCM71 = DSM 17998]|jgi:phosphomannomutase|uniref:Uncharacterized protein n=2 Tax=Rhodonellum TaxID=336827 RepID=U5BXW1_9BACT|nr:MULTISPECIES: hypothetical protein [Rhodonellum]ERM82708.1 hypothetical protein P872_04110 [Rhodonellum psychrophilum GCM71 = DSM 17998]MDO9554432.1 hypothetical protein [Rhodonellum sp.]SDZ29168.1 hypothetical protein SAMN05444412_109120 [Rhodonellum ikkaensis]